MLPLLDTNILLHYIRDDALSRQIEANHLVLAGGNALISIVTEAEIRTLASEFGWGNDKLRRLENFLALFSVVPFPFANIVTCYVQLSEFSRRSGRAMSKNDLWMAATTIATGAVLLTTDRDFEHLSPLFLTLIWIDPAL